MLPKSILNSCFAKHLNNEKYFYNNKDETLQMLHFCHRKETKWTFKEILKLYRN